MHKHSFQHQSTNEPVTCVFLKTGSGDRTTGINVPLGNRDRNHYFQEKIIA